MIDESTPDELCKSLCCENYILRRYPLFDQSCKTSLPVTLSTHNKQRLRVSDVYSSNSDDEETKNKKQPLIAIENNYVQPLIAKENNYVVVAFLGKKAVKHYVGVIISEDVEDFTVKFMQRMHSTNKFTFPNVEDISMVHKKDIVLVLSQPSINTRGQHLLADNHFQYLL
ncbi:unnamed protein product [Psylliodes chrysocephalus]|uniref:Uncharacterized protein n=1 Tax=Psylliodes chrysocephalus TaxID=3402493 RepID=A0A9P0D1V7_9CUCU|nr:unnamed protein product [Psylliodes chrysocephala]